MTSFQNESLSTKMWILEHKYFQFLFSDNCNVLFYVYNTFWKINNIIC